MQAMSIRTVKTTATANNTVCSGIGPAIKYKHRIMKGLIVIAKDPKLLKHPSEPSINSQMLSPTVKLKRRTNSEIIIISTTFCIYRLFIKFYHLLIVVYKNFTELAKKIHAKPIAICAFVLEQTQFRVRFHTDCLHTVKYIINMLIMLTKK